MEIRPDAFPLDKVNDSLLEYRMAEEVSVFVIYDSKKKTTLPHSLKWRGRRYVITKLGYYHAVRQGRTVYHNYHVTDGNLDFSLECNGDNLHWKLKEVIDVSAL